MLPLSSVLHMHRHDAIHNHGTHRKVTLAEDL